MVEFTIKINEEDIKVLNVALINLPYAQVAGLIAKLQSQINEQTTTEDVVIE